MKITETLQNTLAKTLGDLMQPGFEGNEDLDASQFYLVYLQTHAPASMF